MKKEVEEKTLRRMAKVHDFLEMWQGSQNLRATQKEPSTQITRTTAMTYISNPKNIIKASWSLFTHEGAAAFKLSERFPLPPALSAKDLPGGQTEILNVRRIRRIDLRAVESDDGSAPETISDTEHYLNWNRDLDNPNESEDDCEADIKSDIEPDNGIKDPESPEQQDVCAAPNIRRLIWPTGRSRRQAGTV